MVDGWDAQDGDARAAMLLMYEVQGGELALWQLTLVGSAGDVSTGGWQALRRAAAE